MARAAAVLRRRWQETYIDYSLIFIILFLLAFGLIMLYSTSSYEANLDYGDSAYYFKHQLIPSLMGLAGMVVLSYIPDGMDISIDEAIELARFMSRVIDFRSSYTAAHSVGVAVSAVRLAEIMGMSGDE